MQSNPDRFRQNRPAGVAFGFALAVTLEAGGAGAQELRYTPAVDLSITLGGFGAWAISERLRSYLVPNHCRWCEVDEDGNDTVNGLDRSVRSWRWIQHNAADALSDVTAFMAAPITAFGTPTLVSAHDRRIGDFGANALVVAEAGAVAADVNQLVKFLVVRERPDAHARALDEPGPYPRSVDDHLSFYSGHTTEATSLAVAAGTVASMRGYRLAPVVWGAGLPIALATGYLRIAADRHYFTDVLTGALVGAAIGFLVPYVFHRPESASETRPTAMMSGTGQVLPMSFAGVF
jgi:membrane-associated phospholipid phosphatase